MDKQNVFFLPMETIEPLRNYREVIPVSSKDPDVVELAASVQKHGQLQACLVRQHPQKKDKYQLYIGFRRHMAAQVAGLTTLKCEVKDVSDDDVLELQVTENLQRQDPHPMDEAVAFLALQQKRKWSVQELASRFAKSEDYVLHRLKLNELTTEHQEDFKKNKMLLGVALLIARLTPADQKSLRSKFGKDYSAASVASVKQTINQNFIRDLGSATFKTADANLLPSAGACNVCPKRSGGANLLFKDMAKDNRCIDAVCFAQKTNLAFLVNLKEILETQPDVHIVLWNNTKQPAEVTQLLKDMKVKVLHDGSDCHAYSYNKSDVKAKGFYLDSGDKGKIKTIYIKGKGKKAGDTEDGGRAEKSAADVIAGIKQRTARAAELDDEKVHKRIIEAMEIHAGIKEPDSKIKKMPEADTVALAMIVFMELDWSDREAVIKKLGIKGYLGHDTEKNSAAFYQSMRELSASDLTHIVRRVVMRKYNGSTKHSMHGFIFRRIADSLGITTELFEKEQKEERTKREARAAERIAALQPKKKAKPAPTKKAKPKPKPITRKKAA